jgi:hypothetical protein
MEENPYEPPRTPPNRRKPSRRMIWFLTALGFTSVPLGFVAFCVTCTTLATQTDLSIVPAFVIGVVVGVAIMAGLMYAGSRE